MDCPICYDPLRGDHVVVCTPCGMFGSRCIGCRLWTDSMTSLCSPTGHIFHDDCLQTDIGQGTPPPFPAFASHPCPACRSPFSLGEHRSTAHFCVDIVQLRLISAVPNADTAAVGSGLRRLYLNVNPTSPPQAHTARDTPRRRTAHHSAVRTHGQRSQAQTPHDTAGALHAATAQHDAARALHDATPAELTTSYSVGIFTTLTRSRADVQGPWADRGSTPVPVRRQCTSHMFKSDTTCLEAPTSKLCARAGIHIAGLLFPGP